MIRIVLEIEDDGREFMPTVRRIEDRINDGNATSFSPIRYKLKAELIEKRVEIGGSP